MQPDNAARVRDGYIRLGTRGHARSRSTRAEGSICKKNVISRARSCPPVPPQNMVRRGSTVRVRQRASTKALEMGMLCCLRWRDFESARVRDGYILGRAGARGHARRLATQSEACSVHRSVISVKESPCKRRFGVARAGAKVTTSFAREGVVAQSADWQAATSSLPVPSSAQTGASTTTSTGGALRSSSAPPVSS